MSSTPIHILNNTQKLEIQYSAIDQPIDQPHLYILNDLEGIHEHLNFLAEKINLIYLRIASGFLYQSGLSLLSNTIKRALNNTGTVDLIVGSLQTYPLDVEKGQQNTSLDRASASYLKQWQSNYPHRFSLQTIPSKFFHGKFYVLEGVEKSCVLVGSSNVSPSGFTYNHEFNLLYIMNTSSQLFRTFKREFIALEQQATRLPLLNLNLFPEQLLEYDRFESPPLPENPERENYPDIENVRPTDVSPGTMRDIIKNLTDEEIKQRLKFFTEKNPVSISTDLGLPEFEGYYLFEYPQYHLLVLESLNPANALYCFKNHDSFTALKQKIYALSKTEIQERRDDLNLTRKYHRQNRITLDSEILSLFQVNNFKNI